MADARAITIQSGQLQELANPDSLIVGSGLLTPSGSGNNMTLTPDGSNVIIGAAKTLDAATVDRAGTISIGATSGTTITIGRAGQAVGVDSTLNANADVNLGNAASDTISFIGEGDTDLVFVESAARRIDIADETAVDTAGSAMTLSASAGGVASATAGGTGGAVTVVGATGGGAAATFAGGAGGASSFTGGAGGAGVAGAAAGAGGAATLSGGAAGANNGGGGNSGGAATIDGGAATGAGTPGAVRIGPTVTTDIRIGNATTNPTVQLLGTGAVTVAGATTFSAAATALTVNNNALISGTLDAATIDRAGTISIGATSGTSITIGRSGQLTTIAGDLQVDGTETVTGGTTFNDSATFNGNVTFGNASTDTVQFGASDATGSRVGPAGSPNMHFVAGVAHTINIDQSGTEALGAGMTLSAGAGGNSGGAAAGGLGGILTLAGAAGGTGSGTFAGGAGGAGRLNGGAGGAGTATGVAGAGGNVNISAGGAGTDNGGGGANGGNATMDAGAATGAGANGTITIGGSFASAITYGNATTNPTHTFSGTGQVAFAGNVNANNGLDVTVAALTTAAGLTLTGGAIDLDPTGNFALDLDAAQTCIFTVADALTSAFVVRVGADEFIAVDSSTEALNFGNGTTNPSYRFRGTGAVQIDGAALVMPEQAGDPGGTANQGKVYTKDVSGVTELFYQDSAGAVEQISSQAAGDATSVIVSKTANENIAAGAPVNITNDAGNPRIREADADVAARQRVIGLAQAAITSGNAGNVVLQGEVDVPDAQWDAVPAVGDVGVAVYLSTTVGNLTITAPTGNVAVVDVGTVGQGGTGAVKVIVGVKLPVKTI